MLLFLKKIFNKKKVRHFLITRDCISILSPFEIGDTGCVITMYEVNTSSSFNYHKSKNKHVKSFLEDYTIPLWKEKLILNIHKEASKISQGEPYTLTFDEYFSLELDEEENID